MLRRIFLFTVAAIIAVGLMVPANQAFAGQTASITMTVTIANVISVSVDQNTFDLGEVVKGSSFATHVKVTNDGAAGNETFSLSVSDTANWAAKSAAGFNQFRIRALFNTIFPNAVDWSAEDILTATPTPASSTTFTGNQQGYDVPIGETRDLWFQTTVPTTTDSPDQQTIIVTITAAAS